MGGVYLSNWDSGYLSRTGTLELSVGFCAERRKTVNHRNDQTRQPNFSSALLAILRQEKIDIAYPPITWGKLTCCAGAVINNSRTGTPVSEVFDSVGQT